MLDRRNLLAGLTTSLALAACGRGGASDTGLLRVGSQKGGTKALMLASGALDGAPYKIEWSEFPAAQNLLEALGSGAVDVGLVGDAPFQFAYQAGSPIKAIGAQTTQERTEGALALIVPKASTIHGPKDLKGKRIATGRGSVGHYLVLRAMAAAGLGAKDVTITFLSPATRAPRCRPARWTVGRPGSPTSRRLSRRATASPSTGAASRKGTASTSRPKARSRPSARCSTTSSSARARRCSGPAPTSMNSPRSSPPRRVCPCRSRRNSRGAVPVCRCRSIRA
ncbi:ABC transporter substrate-binding protein [Novosphingobium resinovorum]